MNIIVQTNLLWSSCKDGHLSRVKVLMEFHPSLLDMNAPDGTSPHIMAFIKGHQNIVTYFNNEYNLKCYEETMLKSNNETFLTELTLKYPVFNEEVGGKINFEIPQTIMLFPSEQNNLNKDVLGDLCPLRKINTELKILFVKNVKPAECLGDCNK